MELEFGFSETEITPHTPIQTIGFRSLRRAWNAR